MIELSAVFWIFVVLFGIIGLMRGWVREIQATSAAVLAMFIIEKISDPVWQVLLSRTPAEMLAVDPMGTLRRLVMFKAAILLILVFFGYQGPVVLTWATRGRASGAAKPRETIQEGVMGFLVGLLNGYVIVGALWWYLHTAHYPFEWDISPLPLSSSEQMVNLLPLVYLHTPWLEVLVVVFFLIVIIAVL